MKSNYFRILGIVGILVLFICTQGFAEIKINKPEIKNEPGKTILIIPYSGDSVTYTTNKFNRIVYVDIADAVLVGAPKITQSIADSIATKITIAQYQSEPKVVRVVVTLTKWVPFEIKQEEKSIVIAIDNAGESAAATPAMKEEPKAAEKTESTKSEPVQEVKKAKKPVAKLKPASKSEPVAEVKPVLPMVPAVEVKPEPTGLETKITLDFTAAELPNVLRILADKSGLNIIAGPEITGRVTIHLADVTVKEALDTILAIHNCGYEKPSPHVIRIVKLEKPVIALSLPPDEQVVTEVITLNYRNAAEIKTLLTGIRDETVEVKTALVAGGEVKTETKTQQIVAIKEDNLIFKGLKVVSFTDAKAKIAEGVGMIVISGPAATIKSAKELIKKLDRPIKQVMIEARLINIDLDKTKDLGVNWDATKKSAIDSGTYSVEGQTMTQSGALQGGVLIGTIKTGTWDISATLKAAIENKSAEVLANPRILALNNTQASIDITRQNPYVQWSFDALTNTYIGTVNFDDKTKEGITLTVTPQITEDGNILMHVTPNQKTKHSEISYPSAGGAPNTVIAIVDERKADATLLVKDGETIVIGGLRKNEEITTDHRIPVLGDIPFLGNAFRSKSTAASHTELMLFVTPYILKDSTPLTAEEKINFDKIELK
jgi:type IV pilus secretin PilQ/predicted competence protein